MSTDLEHVSAVPAAEAQAQASTTNRYLRHDGQDARSTLRAGLEITGICIIGLAVILTLYYASLRLLSAAFPPKPESAPESDDD